MVEKTLGELAAAVGGRVIGDAELRVRGVAGIREAQPTDITFLANSRYERYLTETRAAAVICTEGLTPSAVPLVVVANPYLAFQKVVSIFRPDSYRPTPGVHPSALVSSSARIGKDVAIGPHCVVEDAVVVGDRVVLMAGAYIGHQSRIGADTVLHPHVVVREECEIGERCILHAGVVIGADGFGFVLDGDSYQKVPQVGNVVVGNDVEIGANTTVDRATTDSTRIGDGTKIDNLVQIGHNVVIGRHCIIVAQVGISGSTHLEDYVTLGGQAGLAGHIRIGTRATVAGKGGVSKSVPAGEVVSGYPAIPHRLFKRLFALFQKLPELFQNQRDFDERLQRIERERKEEAVR
jgi:UDP-3-O-[3-hydroxymyristoyl] glucosamine N-acyltransferase